MNYSFCTTFELIEYGLLKHQGGFTCLGYKYEIVFSVTVTFFNNIQIIEIVRSEYRNNDEFLDKYSYYSIF